MGRFAKGDVVVVRFPFADLSGDNVRPAVVIASLTTGDYLICQITSRQKRDGYSIPLTNSDFQLGGLTRDSYVRPNRLFTAASVLLLGKTGTLKSERIADVVQAIVNIVRS